ncbi:MAG: VOC family protein [Burkholderiales bacterium]|nr:VOC family protein [Burkholderiales bacterium]
MQLNHLNLSVPNALDAAAFFEKYLGFTIKMATPQRHIIAMSGAEFDLVLQECAGEELRYPGNFHIGFIVADLAQLHGLYQRLQADAYPLKTGIESSDRGWQFFFLLPGGVLIEIAWHGQR